MISVKPLHDQIVVELIQKNATIEAAGTNGLDFDVRVTASGIALPDIADNEPAEARVLALGDGRRGDGTIIPFEVVVGDRVLITPWSAVSIIGLDNRDWHIISERDILGKVVECS